MKTTSIIFIIIIVFLFSLNVFLAMSDSITPENVIMLFQCFPLRLEFRTNLLINLVLKELVGCYLQATHVGGP